VTVLRDDQAVVLRPTAPGPRAYLAPESPGTAPEPVLPTSWSPARVTFRTSSPHPATLVVMDAIADGWHAAVDGAEVPIRPAEVVGRGVDLSPGTHAVEMWFDVPLFRWAVRLPSVGLALAFLAMVLHLRRHRAAPPAK